MLTYYEKEANSKSPLTTKYETGFHHEALTYPGTVITIIAPPLPAFGKCEILRWTKIFYF